MSVTIAEEILLLAFGEDDGRQLLSAIQLDPAVAGALLAELALHERIALRDKKVRVLNPAPLGDEELDAALARIAASPKAHRPAWWVQQLQSDKLRVRLLTRLVGAGVLAEERGRVFGIFRTTRWPELDGRVESRVRERIAGALAGTEPDPRTAVLIAVMHAAKLDRKAFPGADKQRIKQIASGAWEAEAVAQTIAAINAGVSIAVTTAAITAAT